MKKIAYMSLGLLFFTSCNNPQQAGTSEKTENQTEEEAPAIGGSKDEHGCLVGAGQTWSEIKQGCIQVFNVGTRLNPVKPQEGEAIMSAFVVANDDKSKIELFLPDDSKKTIILDKGDHNQYQNDMYKYDENNMSLYINGEITYKGNKE
ncbi:hypothetical protein HX021_01770 [Sphingobacterium sp. N143]|uniref:hypothetical protein n=1 Tax=Sphingobacterium sp. N143 TaxID=2746727 RepID=UPI0025773064|nr:hypothetical protein [Sphingobacterium sp. N143]MDM1293023.1 hypothetical protein [Sphingobacterium sp. N143]